MSASRRLAFRCGPGGFRSASWWTACRWRGPGARAVTVGRLTWSTLRVIHTPADVPETLSLEVAERVGRALAAN